jgi:tetratricopeptide (TPR) repeat protein
VSIPNHKSNSIGRIAMVPLVGNQPTEESYWVGALLARLLAEHLRAAGLPALPYRVIAEHIQNNRAMLPLNTEAHTVLRTNLKLYAIVDGRYVLDNDGKMIAIRLIVDALGVSPAPLHSSAPLNAFSPYIERVSLALVERLGADIDESVRQRVKVVQRPASFDAFRQLAQAQATWSKGQKELALAAVQSALLFQPDYEDATAIEVAIAREADDVKTVMDAFGRWAAIAEKSNRPVDAADRWMQLGHWLNERGQWGEARQAYEKARSLYKKLDDELGIARAMNNLASLDLQSGKLHDAIRAYRRSLRTFETNPQTQHDAAMTLANLALAHKNLGQRTEALEAIQQALDLTRRFNDRRLQGHCLAQRGAIHDDMGDWAAALEDYQQASRLLDVAHDDINQAILTGHRALLLKQQGQYAEAERLLLEALAAVEKRNTPHEKAVLWLNVADLYLAMQLYEQSWRYARQAHETFTRLKSGWTVQAQELLDTLTSLPVEEIASVGNNDIPGTPLEPDDGIVLRGQQDDESSAYDHLDESGRTQPSQDDLTGHSEDENLSSSSL